MIRERRLPLLFLTAALVLHGRTEAQSIRLGNEFQVNTHTPNIQRHQAVAADSDGDFVIAWASSNAQDGSAYGVFARRFSSSGTPLASEFLVNTHIALDQTNPSIAANDAGDFVIVWQSSSQDDSTDGVFARRFSGAGTALATEFQVNSYTSGFQRFPTIAADADGDFVVAWQSLDQDGESDGIFARRFSTAGAPLASEFQVNVYTAGYQRFPSVAADADGDFVVVWHSMAQDGAGYGVFARRFSSAGAPLASEFQVNLSTLASQRDPSVAAFPGGSFVVVWASYVQDGAGYGVFTRRFSSAGAPLAGEVQVNLYTTSSQAIPAVAGSDDGTFVVSWISLGQDGHLSGVFARRFSSAGTPLTGEFQVNTYTADTQITPSVAAAGGAFVIAWQSKNQDGSDYGVFAQRFAAMSILDIDGNGATQALSDGLLVLRFLFGLTDNALVSGAVGAGCARCDAATIAPYLAGLGAVLDVDGNMMSQPLADGLLVVRFLFGLSGAPLISGAVGGGCTRCDAPSIAAYLGGLTG